MINRDYGIFTMISHRYAQHAAVQMKSIADKFDKGRYRLTYYLMFNVEETVMEIIEIRNATKAMEDVGINVLHTPVCRDDLVGYSGIQGMNSTEFNKRARYSKMIEILQSLKDNKNQHDAVCFLDADMFIVSDQFFQLFDMVNNTDLFLVCNEKFKWETGQYYIEMKNGREYKPEFVSNKLLKMHCNVPLFFSPSTNKYWDYVIYTYLIFADKLRQVKNNKVVGVGDIFCWNLAIHSNLEVFNKTISFPMEVMTQVHQTNLKFNTMIKEIDGYWLTESGDQVFSLHGRVNEINFVDGGVERFLKDGGDQKQAGKIRESLSNIQNKWFKLLTEVVEYGKK